MFRLNIIRNFHQYFDEEEQRLVLQSIIIGIAVWAIVFLLKQVVHSVFHATLHWVEAAPTPFVVFAPLLLGALLVTAISKYQASVIHYRDKDGHIHELNDIEGDGLERAISLYYSSEPSFEQALTGQEGVDVRWQLPTFSLAVRKFLATLVTLGSGGSGGLEASVTLIGESVAAGLFKPRRIGHEVAQRVGVLGRIWRWWAASNPDNLQTAQLSGIAAAVAVLLGAPFAAAFFATEIMYRFRPVVEKLLYALLSALIAFFLTDIFTEGHPTPFELDVTYVPPADWRYFSVLILVALCIAIISRYFKWLRRWFDAQFHQQPNARVRHISGALLTGIIAVSVHYLTRYLGLTEHGLELVLGPGETVVDMAFAGELTIAVALIALVAKMVATLATITSGGSAGLLIPTLFFGTMTATVFANLFGYEPMMIIIPAMTASLISIANVPLAAILFVVEVFGSVYMLPSLLMLVVASIFTHEATIYRTQRQTYEARQILPGVSVRRVRVPASWTGQTLIELDFRRHFDLNVIGLVERESDNGLPFVRLGTASSTPLQQDDILVVLGPDEKLLALETAVDAINQENPPT
ncbi:MAG: chloride channel protein [Ardenticatenaceae bacterium]|nr:chloride channel protein [Ardenticatenaceae bacterium]